MQTILNKTKRHSLAIAVALISCVVFVVLGLPLWATSVFMASTVIWGFSTNRSVALVEKELKDKQKLDYERSNTAIKLLNTSLLKIICKSLSTPQKQIPLLQELVKKSVTQLDKSFSGLNENTKSQEKILLSLVDKMSENNDGAVNNADENQSLREFASEMRKIVEYFIEQVLMTSQESMTMVHKIDDMAVQMEEVEALVGDVRTIADQTNLLALNAAIEAARAGEAGRGFAVVADEVRKLSQHSNDFSDQISGVVDKALENINEAKQIIGQMASKDMSLAISSKSRVDNMLEEVDHLNGFLSEKLSDASAITESIAENVNLAVMSLQFEDMAKQLTDHMSKQLMHSTEFIESIWEQYSNITRDFHQPDLFEEKINGLRDNVIKFEHEIENKYQTPVSRAQLGHGDVDLF